MGRRKKGTRVMKEEISLVSKNGYLHPCPLLQYIVRTCFGYLGFSDHHSDHKDPPADQADPRDPPTDEENEKEIMEDGDLNQSLVSRKPEKPPPDDGGDGQKN